MKKIILILIALSLTAAFVSAKTSERYTYTGEFYLDIYYDGEMIQDKIMAKVVVANWRKEGKGDGVNWTQIYVRPMDKVKSVRLEPDKYITELGQVKNLVMDKDSVSFDLIIKRGLGIQEMNISLTKSFPGMIISGLNIKKATGYYSKDEKVEHKVEWKETGKNNFVLPYDTVY